jgi:hypothetical protein
MTTTSLSRRSFIWSTLGGIGMAAQTVRGRERPRFGIIGWGNRGSRYLEAVSAARIGVEALCDADEERLRRGADALGRAQRAAVAGSRDYRLLLDSLRTPHVIVSAPFPQAAKIARAAIEQGKNVLLDSGSLFTRESAELAGEAFGNSAGVYVAGLDPRWPTLATRNLFGYALSRGAACVETHFCHPLWSLERLRGGTFEILEALRRSAPSGATVQPIFYTMRCEETSAALIRVTASSDGFQLTADMQIESGGSAESEWELIDDFELFARSSPFEKTRHWGEQYRTILAAREDPISDF